MRQTNASWLNSISGPQQGIENLTDEEAAALIAKDRENHGRDLFNASRPAIPVLDAVHPGDDGGAGEDAPAQHVRPDQVWPKGELPPRNCVADGKIGPRTKTPSGPLVLCAAASITISSLVAMPPLLRK
jgi:hypothetical protein